MLLYHFRKSLPSLRGREDLPEDLGRVQIYTLLSFRSPLENKKATFTGNGRFNSTLNAGENLLTPF